MTSRANAPASSETERRLDGGSENEPIPVPSVGALGPLRPVIFAAVGLYFASTAALNLIYGEDLSYLVYLSYLLVAAVMFGPLLFMPSLGFLHVLVFPALWWFLNVSLRQSTTIAFGLYEHVALPGVTPSELNLLYAKYNALVALAHLSFILGYVFVRRVTVPVFQLRPPTFLRAKVLIVLGIGLAGLVAYDRLVGGLEGMLLFRGMQRVERDELTGGGHFTVLLSMPLVLALVLQGIWDRSRKSLLFWATLAIALISTFLVSGSRGAVLYPVMILLLVHFLRTERLPKLPVILAGLGGWLVMGVVGIFRSAHFGADTVDWGLFADYDLEDMLEAGSTTMVARATLRSGGLPVLFHVPEDSPLLLGSTYMRVLLAPIPQAVLPFEKPVAAGRLNGQTFFMVDAGVPVGPVIEAYWNFHVAGVFLLFFIVGVASAYAFRAYLANSRVACAATYYVFFLLYFKSDTDSLVYLLQTGVVSALLIWFLCGLPRIAGWRRFGGRAEPGLPGSFR